MRLRNKISLAVIFVWLSMFVIAYLGSQYILQRSYLQLEQEQANKNIDRVYQALNQMLQSLNTVVENWAIWDDTYRFVADNNKTYLQANLVPATYASAKVDLMMFYNTEFKPIFAEAVNAKRTVFVSLPQGIERYLTPQSKLLNLISVNDKVAGLISIPAGIILVASHPILTSDNTGPIRGVLIMGRYLTDEAVKTLSKVTSLNVVLYRMDDIKNKPGFNKTLSQLEDAPSSIYTEIMNEKTIKGYKLLLDIDNKPIGILEVTILREVYKVGLATVHYFNLVMLVSGIFLITILMYLIHRMVVIRLEKLNANIINIAERKDFNQKLSDDGNDEVATVTHEVNNLLKTAQAYHDEQRKMHQRLLSISRQAGMSEVATSVLHNIGNILNSANISVSLASEKLAKSHADKLLKIAMLIKEHADKEGYLISDPHGKLIPEYLLELSKDITNENKSLKEELDNVDIHLEHIKEVVAQQKTISGVENLKEKFSLNDTIDLAVQFAASSFIGKDIKITKDYQANVELVSEKSKVLQIVVNLVKNAIDSLLESDVVPKIVVVTIKPVPATSFVDVIVKDNGNGVREENLTRIFSMEFTTKSNGHGFGLHSSAIAAAELQGSLKVESNGIGAGATFILRLPLKRAERIVTRNSKEISNEEK